jgi:phenylacetic acid degradation protein paaN
MTQVAEGSVSVLYTRHEGTLQEAISAIHSRKFYAKYPEPPSPKIYGETAAEEGQKAYQAQLGKSYTLLQDANIEIKGSEDSPYTLEPLGISYPGFSESNSYVQRAREAWNTWKKVDVYTRAGILTEALERIRNRFFELAHATMHTTGQSFVMSFQASGPHSNDRALEALAMGLSELTRFPESVVWTKPMGKMEVVLHKSFRNVSRGVSLAIGCSTFPVWNTVPGMFASLITGNTVVVKPHPKVIYPLALVVDEIQKVLAENGMNPNCVILAPDSPDAPITKALAEHPDVKIIDYTGGTPFGNYVESLPGKYTFTEKAGINSVVLESCKDLGAMMQNLAFSLSLYSGQMCTCPQNIFIPKNGITAGDQKLSYEETVHALADAVKALVTHEKMGPGTLGAIQNPATCDRQKEAEALGLKCILSSIPVVNPEFPNARIATPSIFEVASNNMAVLSKEMFGPVVFVVAVEDAHAATQIAKDIAIHHGAITFSAWTTDKALMDYMTEEMTESFTSVSFNFTGPIWVNQSAGFSDFHVTGGNPSGNASLTDPEFILRRFEIVGVRINEA